jgi:hypothetical protein
MSENRWKNGFESRLIVPSVPPRMQGHSFQSSTGWRQITPSTNRRLTPSIQRSAMGCCNSSKNKHAAKRFHATRHPIVRSIEPDES